LLFANGTALMMLNVTVAVSVFNVTLPAEPAWGPVVKLDGVPVPALVEGRRISVVTGGGGVVTIEYVPRPVDVGGVPAVNITTQDLLLIWASGPLLVMPTVKILNFTRLNHSLVISSQGARLRGLRSASSQRRHAGNSDSRRTAHKATRPRKWPTHICGTDLVYDNHKTRDPSAVCYNYYSRVRRPPPPSRRRPLHRRRWPSPASLCRGLSTRGGQWSPRRRARLWLRRI
jgi:hypothetical protein